MRVPAGNQAAAWSSAAREVIPDGLSITSSPWQAVGSGTAVGLACVMTLRAYNRAAYVDSLFAKAAGSIWLFLAKSPQGNQTWSSKSTLSTTQSLAEVVLKAGSKG